MPKKFSAYIVSCAIPIRSDICDKISMIFCHSKISYINADELSLNLKEAKIRQEILNNEWNASHKIYKLELTEVEGEG